MELLWEELNALRLIYKGVEQATIEGSIPLVDGRSIMEVLDYNAQMQIRNHTVCEDKVIVDGEISVSVLALDGGDDVFAFTSTSAFTHEIDALGAGGGMHADVAANLQTVTISHSADGQLNLAAVADLDCRVTCAIPLRMLGGVSGIGDLEMKKMELPHSRRVEIGADTVRMREELSSDGASEVLHSCGQVYVRDTVMDGSFALVNGVLSVSALCRNPEGDLMQLVRHIPFKESVQLNGNADGLYACARLARLSVRALGTEFALISVDAEVEFRAYGNVSTKLKLPIDAFSPKLSFECLREQLVVTSSLGSASVQSSLRENVAVPDGMADIFTALHAATRPVVTSASFNAGEMMVEGLLFTRLIYRSSAQKLYSFAEDIPFSVRLKAPQDATQAQVKTTAVAAITGGSGRAAQIAFTINIDADYYNETGASAVAGIAECEPPETSKGIIIYIAVEGEDVFDIAKRFRIPSAQVLSLNPKLSASLNEGDRVLLFV